MQEEEKKVTNEELMSLKNTVVQLENNYKRALADYQNLQRRTQEQKGEWIRQANRDLILNLLPVLDTLLLTLHHSQDKALELAISQFLSILEQEGITRIKTIGESFDPHTMEAITTVAGEEGKVIDEARSGYILGETVLRAAQVVVGSGEKN